MWKCDLDLWGRNTGLARDTSLWYAEHTWQIILKFVHACMRKLQPGHDHLRPYVQTLNTGLARNTSSWYAEHTCQVILKSVNTWESYSPDTTKFGRTHGRTDSRTHRRCDFSMPTFGGIKQHIVQTIYDNNVPPHQIMQITGTEISSQATMTTNLVANNTRTFRTYWQTKPVCNQCCVLVS